MTCYEPRLRVQYTLRYHVNFFMLSARSTSRTLLCESKFENILSNENSHGIQVLKAGLEASSYKKPARYATQVDSCLSWFQVPHAILEVARSNPRICIFVADWGYSAACYESRLDLFACLLDSRHLT